MLTQPYKLKPDSSIVLLTLAVTTGIALASSLHATETGLTPVRLDEVTLPLMVMSAAGTKPELCNCLGSNHCALKDIDTDTLIRHSNLALSENAHSLDLQPIRSGRTMTHDLAQWLLPDSTTAGLDMAHDPPHDKLLNRLRDRCKAVLNPNAEFYVDLPMPHAAMMKTRDSPFSHRFGVLPYKPTNQADQWLYCAGVMNTDPKAGRRTACVGFRQDDQKLLTALNAPKPSASAIRIRFKAPQPADQRSTPRNLTVPEFSPPSATRLSVQRVRALEVTGVDWMQSPGD